LHVPGGRNAPWQHGLWRALGRAWIRKEHANMHKDNWEAKLANPARVAVAPQGATEEQQENWFRRVMAWGVNTVFGMKPGYDVRLLESNGRGWDSFNQTIKDQNNEMTIALAGQTVTTDGGAGFSNADIHKSIRSDLIQATADALAYTLNTQGLPPFILERFGEEALDNGAIVQWDTKPAKDQSTEATAMVQAATAITTLRDTLSASGKVLDVDALCVQFGIPVVAPNEVVDAEADKKAA
jgi:phage gp29-like protein